MADFTKLSNLFTANQRLLAYNTSSKKRTDEQKELADVNGDGKIDSTDKKIIQQQIKEAKQQKVFDFDGDNDVDLEDWSLLNDEIDLDGDGEISDAEKNFISSQKKSMATTVAKSVTSSKYTGEFNGKMYKDGKVLTGFADDGLYYANGSLKTGSVKVKENGKSVSYYFVNGEKAQGKVGNYMYKDGLKFTGFAEDGLYYANGSLKTGNVKDGNTTSNYKNGVLQYSVTDNNTTKTYPNAKNNKIIFADKKTSVTLEVGSSAVINEDGTVEITDKDNVKVKYDSEGNIIKDVEPTPPDNNDRGEVEQEIVEEYDIKDLDYEDTINVNGKEIKLSITAVESGKITVAKDGTINIYNTSVDGKASSISFSTNEDLKIVMKSCINESFTLTAGKGNDNIVIEEGVSMYQVDGNDGNDNIEIKKHAKLTRAVYGDNGDDIITNSGDISHLVGGDGNDTLINTTSGTIRCTFTGNAGNDTMKNQGKLELSMDGGIGNDTLINETGGYAGGMYGFDGDDTITNDGVTGTIKGGQGNDNITNNNVATSMHGEGGDDIIDNRGETGSISDFYGNNTLKNAGLHASEISGEQYGLGMDLKANITYEQLYKDYENGK